MIEWQNEKGDCYEEISINNYGTYFGNGMFDGGAGGIYTEV